MEDKDLMDSGKVKGVLEDVDDRKVQSLWKTLDGYDLLPITSSFKFPMN